jgi:hypothetical protein
MNFNMLDFVVGGGGGGDVGGVGVVVVKICIF